ncbi:MAG: peptidoglycan glycosyltransferase [Crocinitomicaceae bacterium]|nr:peptidoglycan glycosyltransferase [Crocinitomicaceae bacterium]
MNLRERQWIIGGIFLLIAIIFIGRLIHLQLFSGDLQDYAARLTQEREVLEPARGLVYDRNGQLFLDNQAGYDILFTPRQCRLGGGMDTLALAQLIDLTPTEIQKAIRKAEAYATYRPSSIRKQMPASEYASIAGELWRFPGIQVRRQSIRTNESGLCSHLLGEYREVDRDDLQSNLGYQLGDYKGKSGLELQWENELKGEKGVKFHLVDVRNDYRQSAQKGALDSMPIPGENLILTLDMELQAYGEKIMEGKRGSIVAIEPESGEVLAMVSAPSYETNLLTGRMRGANYDSLLRNPDKPLFNRTTRATYRPGSIFKMIQGLIALDKDLISPRTRIPCNRTIIGCHGGHTNDNLEAAIVHSCNPYFHEVMRRMIQPRKTTDIFSEARNELGEWTKSIERFGFGTDLGGNFPGLRSGSVPDTTLYDKLYGKKRWAYSTIYSISIGEGELLTTPLHMANLAATIANQGEFRTPHVVQSIGLNGKPAGTDSLVQTGISRQLFEPIIEAMNAVTESKEGTAPLARVPGVKVCGKTGTVQDSKGNHSVFIAFAPVENPKIALSVYVENAGAGGDWAAPIASLLMEKYLKGSVKQANKELRVIRATYPFANAKQ